MARTFTGGTQRRRAGQAPRPASRLTWRLAREALMVTVGALLYFLVRGLMDSSTDAATANAEALIALEQWLGIYWEPWLQGIVIENARLTTLANQLYIFGHWPVIAATLAWLVARHPEAYTRYRSAMLISGAVGLVIFLLLPMAPPRLMLEYGFVDTVTRDSNAYRVLQPPSLTNPIAAMPSLHVGWNLLMGLALARHAGRRWLRATGQAMPAAMWLATVVTANHYLLDGLAGVAIVLPSLWLAVRLGRRSGSERVDSDSVERYDTPV